MKAYYLILIPLALLTIQCKHKGVESTSEETLLAKRYQADRVSLTQNKSITTTNGISSEENYLLIRLYNPKPIIKIKFNQRILETKCDNINDYLQDSIMHGSALDYQDVRIDIVEEHGLIFKTEESTILKYPRK